VRHLLNWLLRFGLSESDRQAILGDLEEEYRARVRPGRSWLGAHAWYAGQVVAAAVASQRRYQSMASTEARSRWRLFVMTDVRYALRRWRRRPGFALTAVLTLGLGIGAATAMFSVVDAVLLRPLPWLEPDRLVVVHAVYPERRNDPARAANWDRATLHWPAWDALRTAMSLETAVWRLPAPSTTLGEHPAELVQTMDVSSNFLPMLGAKVALGRNFSAEEDEQPTDTAILTHEVWQRRFGGRSDIVGLEVTVGSAGSGGRVAWTVIGVLEPGFSFDGLAPELLRPVGVSAEPGRRFVNSSFGQFRAVARLAHSVSFEAAAAEAASLVRASDPDEPAGARLVPLAEEQLGASARPLWLLFGGAGLLLLVACANVAGLLIGEGRARRHEIAIRLALGVSGGRVVRQLVAEHLILAMAGAATGLVLAAWLTQSLVAIAPEQLPRIETVDTNWRVAGFALGAGGLMLLVFGLAPAFSLARTRASAMLVEGGRQATLDRQPVQRGIVVGEVALALVLVVGAGLLGETMFRLLARPLGFDPTNLAVVSTRYMGPRYGGESNAIMRRAVQTLQPADFRELQSRLAVAEATARTGEMLARLSALPGVADVAGAYAPPFVASPVRLRVRLEGWPPDREELVQRHVVTERFFQTMRLPILEGRGFRSDDRPDGPLVAVASREFERRLFPDGAVGRRFFSGRTAYDVIGVVPDVKQRAFSDDAQPLFYALDRTSAPFHLIVRASTDASAVLPSIRQAIADVNPQMVVTATQTMDGLLAGTIAEERFRAMLSAGFAGTALVLAAVGLYGVAARRVAERRRELGVRVALGARPANLRALVLRDASLTVGLGLAIGLPAAFAASQVTRAFLFGVSPTAPHVFVVASVVLAAAALAATILPARRASRVDPMLALRD